MTAAESLTHDAALLASAEALGQALAARRMRLAVAESCTGGWVAKTLTDVPGASDWFEAGFVTYSNDAKSDLLGVSQKTLDEHGAVSEAVVRQMTAGARRSTGASAAIAVSGIAGPGGGTVDKPVGLVYFAWSLGERDWVRRVEFSGDREAIRRQAVEFAIRKLLAALTA